MSRFKELKQDTRLSSGLYAVTMITALLILAVVVRGPEKTGELVVNEDGRVVGISRHRLDRTERYELSLEVDDGEERLEREVDLTLQASAGSRKPMKISEEDDREAALAAGIDSVINEVEHSRARRIKLPDVLPDGTPIIWKGRKSSGDGGTLLLILGIYAALVAVMIGSRFRKDRSGDEERRSILRGLPRFCNQLFLMMNAGLILSDAFDIISGSYVRYKRGSLSRFETDLAALSDATDGHRISTAYVINEYAVKHDVKEMIRIAAILNENEKRGSDVIESLERESRYLWEERKIVARESGRMIDSRMSYPLGLLLIMLIVITIAPALLGM